MKSLIFLTGVLTFSCENNIEEGFCPGLDCTSSSDSDNTGDTSFSVTFSDSFNRADGLLDSATWSVINLGGSSMNILSNQVQPLSNLSFQPVAMHSTSISATAFRISIDIEIGGPDFSANVATGNIGIFALSQSTANFQNTYFCGIEGNVNGDSLFISVSVGGMAAGSTVDPGSVPLANGDNYTLTFTINSGTLTCKISGDYSATVTHSDSNFTSGFSGFGGGNTAAAAEGELLFDDFLIEIF